jgi:molybdopterin molybdotransferase
VVLCALIQAAGGTAEVLPTAGDTLGEAEKHFTRALEQYEVLVTVGGVSVGDRDVVRPALENVGVKTVFHKVRIKPGKPIYYGRRGGTHVLGLPGNPVSAQVTFALFGVPLLRALQGSRHPALQTRTATLAAPWRGKSGRRGFYRVCLEGDRVTPVSNQASGATVSSALANALWVVPERSEAFEAGEQVEIIPYREFS